jgi:hypothetical protein
MTTAVSGVLPFITLASLRAAGCSAGARIVEGRYGQPRAGGAVHTWTHVRSKQCAAGGKPGRQPAPLSPAHSHRPTWRHAGRAAPCPWCLLGCCL